MALDPPLLDLRGTRHQPWHLIFTSLTRSRQSSRPAISAIIAAGILIYTSDWFERFYPSFTPLDKLLLVVVLEHALIGLKLLIDACVPDMPAGVRIALAREEWLADQRVARNDQRSTTEGSLGEPQ